jgi:hypothetical protein
VAADVEPPHAGPGMSVTGTVTAALAGVPRPAPAFNGGGRRGGMGWDWGIPCGLNSCGRKARPRLASGYGALSLCCLLARRGSEGLLLLYQCTPYHAASLCAADELGRARAGPARPHPRWSAGAARVQDPAGGFVLRRGLVGKRTAAELSPVTNRRAMVEDLK